MARPSARMALVVIADLAGRAGLAGLLGLVCCAETSPSGVVVAPVAAASSGSPAVPDAATGEAIPADGGSGSDASPGGNASPGSNATSVSHATAATAPARFRACAADADCVAVPGVGCCQNGWNEAVAVSQKDAYAASFVCPVAHPICAMVVVRDTRQPGCDAAMHLCTMR
jgi:hypothetical protein